MKKLVIEHCYVWKKLCGALSSKCHISAIFIYTISIIFVDHNHLFQPRSPLYSTTAILLLCRYFPLVRLSPSSVAIVI